MIRPAVLPPLFAAGLALAAGGASAADYVTIRNEVIVNRPIDVVWKRVGGYCTGISEWLKVTCEFTAGTGEIGTVRRLNGVTSEPMVGRTAHSYTYWQTEGNMAYAAYHGTLAAEPDGPNRTRLSYTLFYDQAAMASDEVRKSEHERIDKRFGGALQTMKSLVEGK